MSSRASSTAYSMTHLARVLNGSHSPEVIVVPPPVLPEHLHRPLTINFRNHNVQILGILASLHQDGIARENPGVDHRIPLNPEQIGGLFVPDEVLLQTEGIEECLFGRRREAHFDGAQHARFRKGSAGKESSCEVLLDELE